MSEPTKGMVAGKPITSDAVTKEYEDGHARTFGEPRPFPRGRRFRWDPGLKKLVPAGYVDEPRAVSAPVMAGRFYENTKAVDGTDIGSRRKRNEYMRQRNLADTGDFKGVWEQAAKERESIQKGEHDRRARRDAVGRAIYELEKGSR